MRKIIPFFLAFTLIFSGIAQANAAVDAAGAATLKKQIDDDLQWRNDMAKIIGQGLVSDGKTDVTPKNGAYEVNVPHLYLLSQQGKLEIGHVTLNIAPAPEAGAWLIQKVSVPSSMILYDTKNVPAIHITLGSQHFTAIWRPDQGLYPKVDSLVENIKLTGAGENAPTVKVASFKSLVNLKDNGNGTWSGPADFSAGGIAIDAPGQNPVAISIDKAATHNIYDRLDASQLMKAKEAAQKSLKGGLPQTEQEKKAFLAKLIPQNTVSTEGFSTTIEVGKFAMHDTGSQQQPRRDVSFNRFVFSGLSPNMKQEKNKLLLKIAFDGLNFSFVPAPLADMIPHTLNTEITLENLPIGQMTEQIFTIITKRSLANATNANTPKQVQAQAKADSAKAVDQLSRTLKEAEASIAVNNTYLKSNALGVSLQSKLDASTDNVLGVNGKTTVAIKGLDEFVQKIQDAALRPGSDPHLLAYLMGFMTIQTKGVPSKAADGISIRNFAVELKKNGDVILNDAVLNPKTSAPAPQTP